MTPQPWPRPRHLRPPAPHPHHQHRDLHTTPPWRRRTTPGSTSQTGLAGWGAMPPIRHLPPGRTPRSPWR